MEKILNHLNSVLWDEKFEYKNKAYVWHVKYWEFYVLGSIAAALIYTFMIVASACVNY